jgi:hypothetical protein
MNARIELCREDVCLYHAQAVRIMVLQFREKLRAVVQVSLNGTSQRNALHHESEGRHESDAAKDFVVHWAAK